MKPLPVILGVFSLLTAMGVISWMSQQSASETVVAEPAPPPKTNPLEVTTAGPQPRAVLTEDLFDFGKMILGETGSHTFVIRNEGDAPLKLKKGVVLCKCTVPDVPGGAIPPGESAEIVLEWKPVSPTVSFDKYAEIWTNDPENENLKLTITGEVATLVQVEPPSPWTVTAVREEEPSTFSGAIASGRDAFEIVSVETSADWLEVAPRPIESGELEELGEGMASGYVLEGTIRPSMPVGRFEEKITITTDLTDEHTLEIVVSGTRPGPFSIIGTGWQGREMTVALEEVDVDKGKSTTVYLITSREDEPLELEKVTSDPDIVQVELKRDETFPSPVKEKYDLTFTIPPGSRPGQYSRGNRIAVTLETSRESIPRVELSVDAIVQ